MEITADKTAVMLEDQPGMYARALEKLAQKNLTPAVIDSNNRAHPHLYDRMLSAGLQPDFERPRPADSWSNIYIITWIAFGLLIFRLLGRW
jgi:hypothetical protein